MTRVLFVCLGNICRSPTAEAVARRDTGWRVDSAGTGDWHLGEPPYGPMQAAARAVGLDMSDLRARQFTRADFDRFDLIVGMDGENIAAIEALRPEGASTPVVNLAHYAGADAVPDPYFTRDFEGALALIERAVRGLAASENLE